MPVSSVAAALPSAMDSALAGMQTAQARVAGDAATIATTGPDVASMVDLSVQGSTYGALAKVVRTADEMTGSALDILA